MEDEEEKKRKQIINRKENDGGLNDRPAVNRPGQDLTGPFSSLMDI